MNLIWLEDFLALAPTGNFSRAAEERHSSQPAFSRRIRALEAWVGAELFDRSTQPARLTDVGKWFLGVAQDLLARVSRVPGDAQRVAEASSVTLRLASTHALSFTFLPRWLRGLEATAALESVQLMSDVLQRCEALMREGKAQFVLSHAHAQAPGALDADAYLAIQVGDDELIPVCSPNEQGEARHLLGTGAGVPLLHYSEESGLGRIIRSVFDRRLAAANTVFTAHAASVLRTMALDGRGVAWLPHTLVVEDLDAGSLVAAGGEEWSLPVAIKLYRERELSGRAAEALWQAVTMQEARAID
ncbi:LysR substrate-binding domain-containing protein [Halomonas salipaludis]|uniref:LysR family transcriptional regulator n=1 Tax=Halomonas salipaludis TaxID=2032625 RepID=A0A2A2F1E2_9GAMM|nr:LysR substrate-binding domain-containing protein [Halomonas salipaludis]PAU78439.1 LysR family transcriptional regulator [Halomonas salipaludis]